MLRLINGTGRQRRRVIFLPWHRRDIKPLYAWRGPGAPATWSCKHDVIIMKFSVRRRFFPVSRRHFLFYTWLSVYRLIYIYRRTPLHAQLIKFTRKFSVVFALALSIIRAVGPHTYILCATYAGLRRINILKFAEQCRIFPSDISSCLHKR